MSIRMTLQELLQEVWLFPTHWLDHTEESRRAKANELANEAWRINEEEVKLGQVSAWIKPQIRMPERHLRVLVHLVSGYQKPAPIYIDYCEENWDGVMTWRSFDAAEVLGWMPFPESPAGAD